MNGGALARLSCFNYYLIRIAFLILLLSLPRSRRRLASDQSSAARPFHKAEKAETMPPPPPPPPARPAALAAALAIIHATKNIPLLCTKFTALKWVFLIT